MRAKDGRVEILKDPRTLVASWYSCISAKLPFLDFFGGKKMNSVC